MKMKKADPKHTAAKEAAMRKKLDKKDEKLTKAKEKMEEESVSVCPFVRLPKFKKWFFLKKFKKWFFFKKFKKWFFFKKLRNYFLIS